jgi:hypothetical protein
MNAFTEIHLQINRKIVDLIQNLSIHIRHKIWIEAGNKVCQKTAAGLLMKHFMMK